ncbi:MAG: hypothetical protein IVW54_06915 [Candidatus Binataceae bacterium]|nr:hypothetical protein [Candidatus Binataceae bacterium]
MEHKFQNKSKFALLTFNNAYVDLSSEAFQLSDGTWAMPGVPVRDLGIWKEWIGSIRMERLREANLVLFVEEPSDNPEILDAVHNRLSDDLSLLFSLLHLRSGIECESANLLCGSSQQGVPEIRQMGQLPAFFQTKGYRLTPITQEWLEDATALRAGATAMAADKADFRRVIRGLNTLLASLKQTGQDRLHQFVRSLEALILPDVGKTKNQFTHRCQTFAGALKDTRLVLQEAFDMRSDTEHLHEWYEAAQNYPANRREDVCWQRTRQIEQLACDAYSRLLRSTALRERFRTDANNSGFLEAPRRRKMLHLGETPRHHAGASHSEIRPIEESDSLTAEPLARFSRDTGWKGMFGFLAIRSEASLRLPRKWICRTSPVTLAAMSFAFYTRGISHSSI